MTQKNTFKKEERLSSKKEFEMVMANGGSVNRYPFRLIFTKEATAVSKTPVKVAIGVSKKRVKLAVNRNRIKRLFREAYRLNKAGFVKYAYENKITFRLLFVFTGKPAEADFNIFTTKIILLLQRLQSTDESPKGSADTPS